MINIIDVEASGLHFDSYPIEAAVLINGQSYSWLIKPEARWQYWCETAESLHGITREALQREGESAAFVVNQLLQRLEGSDGLLYSDAANWDADWMGTLFHAAEAAMPFHIASIYDLLDNDRSQRFDRTKARLAQSGEYRQHRAAEDVRMIHQAYVEAAAVPAINT